ncbi:acetoacetyl-CoA reductase [Candidatus Paracaedimonas acanthamoebae]|nr:acetoacetyl-CoA reductase [Candidatus Paracaedimonas acanthamoebae]
MTGHVAIVTGGTRGIGASISQALMKAGYRVAATYQADDIAAETFRRSTNVAVFRWDVSHHDDCIKGIQTVQQQLGNIDVLINNAGITSDSMFHKSTAQDWTKVLNTNLVSCFNMAHAVIGGMRERNYGRIINISSINGQKGQLGQTNYAAAKAGIIGFTKALALENARKNITVNAIAPGYIATDMVKAVPQEALDKIVAQIPVGRLGEPEEIARAVVFLAAEEAGFITGSTLSINGGQYMV